MEKLIELLNEYEPYIQNDGTPTDNFWWYVSQGNSAVFPKEVGIDRIISNEYGFIKWLIDNDKINKKIIQNEAEYFCEEYYYDKDCLKRTLMLLSIQENPINFLISILK